MPTMPTAKGATDFLKAYGFTEIAPGMFLPARGSSERWELIEDGSGDFYCYAPAIPGVNGGAPWGQIVGDGPLMRVPYRQTEAFKDVSGLHPAAQPDAFEWRWPGDRVREIYQYAPSKADPETGTLHNRWIKGDDGVYREEGS